MENEILILAQGLKKYFQPRGFFGLKNNFIKAVDDISLEIYKGETFGLVGESGCGKSTLGRTLIRMYEPTGGSIFYKGEDITHIKASQLKMLENRFQIIFQDPYMALDPFWNVGEILEEPLRRIGMDSGQWSNKIKDILEKVGLGSDDVHKFPYEFSGGQRQRIGIARALAVNPEFIMCDEPIAALDVSIQAQVVNLLQDLQEELGLTYLFTAHDLSMVRYISTRIGVMYLGRIVEKAKSRELFKNPLHPYTKLLLSSIPLPDPENAVKKRKFKSVQEAALTDVMRGCNFAPRCEYKTELCLCEVPILRELEAGHFVACHNAKEIN